MELAAPCGARGGASPWLAGTAEGHISDPHRRPANPTGPQPLRWRTRRQLSPAN